MKPCLLWLFGVWSLMAWTSVYGQLDARLILDFPQYVQFEPVTGRLVLHNRGGGHIELEPDDFYFSVKFARQRPVQRLDALLLPDPLRIAASQTVTQEVNFSKSFRIRDSGPYTFGGRIDLYGRNIDMPLAYADVMPGLVLKSMETVGEMDGERVVRAVKLLSLYRDTNQHLFLSIQDPVDFLSFGVYDLGTFLSSGDPVLAASEDNLLHVLHRAAPAQYIHSSFSLNGTPQDRGVYAVSGKPPELVRDESGSLRVRGSLVEAETGPSRVRTFTLE